MYSAMSDSLLLNGFICREVEGTANWGVEEWRCRKKGGGGSEQFTAVKMSAQQDVGG